MTISIKSVSNGRIAWEDDGSESSYEIRDINQIAIATVSDKWWDIPPEINGTTVAEYAIARTTPDANYTIATFIVYHHAQLGAPQLVKIYVDSPDDMVLTRITDWDAKRIQYTFKSDATAERYVIFTQNNGQSAYEFTNEPTASIRFANRTNAEFGSCNGQLARVSYIPYEDILPLPKEFIFDSATHTLSWQSVDHADQYRITVYTLATGATDAVTTEYTTQMTHFTLTPFDFNVISTVSIYVSAEIKDDTGQFIPSGSSNWIILPESNLSTTSRLVLLVALVLGIAAMSAWWLM